MKKIAQTLSLSFCLLYIGCGKGGYFAESVPAATPLACTTGILDKGNKSNTYSRGLCSDTKMIPGSSYPAIAYNDVGSLALKLNYWNGSENVVETISGDYAATAIRLVFTSTGIPWVFWVSSGTYVKAAVRSASLASAGSWTVGEIDSGSAGPIEVAINPLDQIGVSFINSAVVTGRPRFLYCTTCTNPNSFIPMNPTTYIEDVNMTAAQTQMGMAWCKASPTLYYPAVTYTVAAAVQYAVCRSANLANCLSSASWTTQSVVGTADIASKLYLDPTVTGDVPKVISIAAGGTGMITYKMDNSTSCAAAPTTFSAGATLGGANSGTKAFSILKDAANKFHVIANESTTSLRYYNSTSTDFTGTWNGAGVIATVSLGAPNMWLGADIDLTNSGIYTAYGIMTGTTTIPNDLRLARISNYSVASDSSSLAISKYHTDTTGSIQLAVSPKRNIATRSTSEGLPAVAYVDYSGPYGILKYAVRTGTSASSPWDKCTIPEVFAPHSPSLAFDSRNRPWIGYYDTNYTRFYLATTYSTNCGGAWTVYEFPYVPSGAGAALPASNDIAVTMYRGGGVDYPLVAILDTNATSKGIYTAYLNPTEGKWSAVSTVVTLGTSTAANVDLDSDSSGNAVMAYYDITLGKARYSMTPDGATWSTPLSVSGISQGMGSRIRLQPSTSYPSITYFDRSGNTVNYSSCAHAPSECTITGWNTTAVDVSAGVSGLSTSSDLLLSASLVFDSSNIPYVIYPHGKAADGNLISTQVKSTGNTSTVIGYGVNGNSKDNPAFNYGVAGWGVSATPNAAGLFTSIYVGPSDWLYYSSCGD